MKHGDKAKSKAASKASGEKSSKAGASSKAAGAKSSKANQAVSKHQAASKTAKQIPAGKSHAAGDNGKARPRLSPDELTFSNPIVSAAYKRAVKKYANAFRKLTD